jgi:hypothetical protein
MVIDIKRTVIKIQLRRFITVLLFIAIIVFLLTGIVKEKLWELSKYQWSMFVAALYLLTLIIDNVLEPYYIYYSDEGKKIIFRYFSLGFFNRRKSSIEIPKEQFVGFRIEKSLFGFKEKIILMQHVKNIDAKYPSVSLWALSKTEKHNLTESLKSHSQVKS